MELPPKNTEWVDDIHEEITRAPEMVEITTLPNKPEDMVIDTTKTTDQTAGNPIDAENIATFLQKGDMGLEVTQLKGDVKNLQTRVEVVEDYTRVNSNDMLSGNTEKMPPTPTSCSTNAQIESKDSDTIEPSKDNPDTLTKYSVVEFM